MNNQLFYSSSIIGIIIIFVSFYFYSEKLLPLYTITFFGIITSIINHGITNKSAKNLDRCIMLISAIVYIYYGLEIENKYLQIATLSIIALMMFTYVSSKFIKGIIGDSNLSSNIHFITHCITLFPFCMIVINDYMESKTI